MVRLAISSVVAMAAGCFSPSYPSNVPCAANGECPGTQVCEPITQICDGTPPGTDAPARDSLVDAFSPDALVTPWNAPSLVHFGTEPSASDTDPAISSDGLELLFSRDVAGEIDIYRATRQAITDDFSPAAPVTELNTTSEEGGAELTADGLTVYFKRSLNIYVASRTARDQPFSAPVVDDVLSSSSVDFDPAISRDGRIAIVVRQVSSTDRDMYIRTRSATTEPWGPASLLAGDLQSPRIDSGPAFAGDPATLYFHSNRVNAAASDLFVVHGDPDGTFDPPRIISELATSADEGDPTLTPDARLMIFKRGSSLYQTTR